MKELLKSLAGAKKKIGVLCKDETNPFYKSKFFDINSLIKQVEPLLEVNGLLLLQPIENNKVMSVIWHIETGEKVISEIELPNLTDPQKLGSAITYYRRYTLQSLLGLQAEDDDGNKAAAPSKQKATTEILQKAKQGGFTIQQVKAKYQVSKEQETEFNNL